MRISSQVYIISAGLTQQALIVYLNSPLTLNIKSNWAIFMKEGPARDADVVCKMMASAQWRTNFFIAN